MKLLSEAHLLFRKTWSPQFRQPISFARHDGTHRRAPRPTAQGWTRLSFQLRLSGRPLSSNLHDSIHMWHEVVEVQMRTRARVWWACWGGVGNSLAARLRHQAYLFAVDPLLFIDQRGPHLENFGLYYNLSIETWDDEYTNLAFTNIQPICSPNLSIRSYNGTVSFSLPSVHHKSRIPGSFVKT